MNPREANSGKIGDQRNSVMYIAGELQRTHQTALEAQVHLSYRSLVRVMAEMVAEQDVYVYVCVIERWMKIGGRHNLWMRAGPFR
jgi:hypothetical protein